MPRIRSIKPEAPQHPKVGRLSDAAFRLWIVALTQADDAGRLHADAGQLKLLAFGYHDDVTTAKTEAILQEVAETGLIELYEVGGVRYGHLPGWLDHQVINKPRPSKLPAPPVHSGNATGTVPDSSRTTTGGSEGSEGSRIGRIGKEGSDEGRKTLGDESPKPPLVAHALQTPNSNGKPACKENGQDETRQFKALVTELRLKHSDWTDEGVVAAAQRETERLKAARGRR